LCQKESKGFHCINHHFKGSPFTGTRQNDDSHAQSHHCCFFAGPLACTAGGRGCERNGNGSGTAVIVHGGGGGGGGGGGKGGLVGQVSPPTAATRKQ